MNVRELIEKLEEIAEEFGDDLDVVQHDGEWSDADLVQQVHCYEGGNLFICKEINAKEHFGAHKVTSRYVYILPFIEGTPENKHAGIRLK